VVIYPIPNGETAIALKTLLASIFDIFDHPSRVAPNFNSRLLLKLPSEPLNWTQAKLLATLSWAIQNY
jgi:hypothetical protein